MKVVTNLSLVPTEPRNEVSVSALLADGRPTGVLLEGTVLEAAVESEGLLLLFLTDDVPFEEILRIVLLDRAFQPLESLCIGSAYASGHFCDLVLEPPDTVRFRSLGEMTWRLTLHPELRLRVPLLFDPAGVSRGWRLRSRLAVRRDPAPEGTSEPDGGS